ncbi:hypothetical protein CR513_32329, partial [Mucuna pruriens]
MQEESDQFQNNGVWKLVPLPKEKSIIRTKRIYRNKLHENGKVVKIKESLVAQEFYMKQPLSFENDSFPNHVFKLKKALCGLKQALRAWYEKLSSFLMGNSFSRKSLH